MGRVNQVKKDGKNVPDRGNGMCKGPEADRRMIWTKKHGL